MIKIAFFDVDGTLLDYGKKQPSVSTLAALKELQKKGIKLVISSGRAPFAIPKIEDLDFDALISYTGAIVYADGQVIYEKRLPYDDLVRLEKNLKEMGSPVCFASRDHLFSNAYDPVLEEYLQIAHLECPVVDDFETQIQQPIYQGMAPVPMDQKDKILQGVIHADITGWWPKACDIIPKDNSKGVGVQKILEYYGLKKEEAIAFGDGDNDIDMMEAVGTKIVMGNGTDAIKRVADFITKDVSEDGIVYALREYGLL